MSLLPQKYRGLSNKLALALFSTVVVCSVARGEGLLPQVSQPQTVIPSTSVAQPVIPQIGQTQPGRPQAQVQYVPQPQAAPSEVEKRRALKKAMLERLVKKLNRKDGKLASFVVFTPLDLTQHDFGAPLTTLISNIISSYAQVPLQSSESVVENLTLEELRKLLIRHKADVLIASSLKPTSFDIYLYDSATPYYIYAHSEPIPAEARLDMSSGTIPKYVKVAVRKLLFRYLQNQFFEIPRSDEAPVLKSEVPRWIASTESLSIMQKDLASSAYLSVSYGAALASGPNGGWNSSLINAEVGIRVYSHLFVEGAIDSFSDNALTASLKYVFDNRNHPFSFALGLGLSYITGHKAIDSDPNNTLGGDDVYVVPSASILLPLSDVHFKAETRLYLSGGKYVFTLMPGFLLQF